MGPHTSPCSAPSPADIQTACPVLRTKRYRVSLRRNIARKLLQSGTTAAAASKAPSRSIVPNALLRSSATQQSAGRASAVARTVCASFSPPPLRPAPSWCCPTPSARTALRSARRARPTTLRSASPAPTGRTPSGFFFRGCRHTAANPSTTSSGKSAAAMRSPTRAKASKAAGTWSTTAQ